ncbi:MAG: hypothetical protein Q8L60_12685, partial [Gammaproteobacteria bacterium]|nr:hypothetical protein [Gammaproteobacteria bacterium]MDP2348475.1 hypothetical protein [Gammaproteobacteria bacterium]
DHLPTTTRNRATGMQRRSTLSETDAELSAVLITTNHYNSVSIKSNNAFLQRRKHVGVAFAQAKGMTACFCPTARICYVRLPMTNEAA